MDGCLLLAPQDYVSRLAERVRALPLTDPAARLLRRHLFSAAVPASPDGSTTLSITPQLRAFANLSDQVVIVGNDAYLEVWNPQAWERMKEEGVKMMMQEDWSLEGI